jgi:hypothetical protein
LIAFAFSWWALSLGGRVPGPALLVGLALVPPAVGGWLLGRLRRR